MYMHIHIYIYIERERDGIIIYIYIYMLYWLPTSTTLGSPADCCVRCVRAASGLPDK